MVLAKHVRTSLGSCESPNRGPASKVAIPFAMEDFEMPPFESPLSLLNPLVINGVLSSRLMMN